MEHARIDISHGLDGQPVVFACFDLGEQQVAASVQAVRAGVTERFQTPPVSADEVLELRELTALVDELGELSGAAGTVVLRPARLLAFRGAVARFVSTRDETEWISFDDRQALEHVRPLLAGLDQLCAAATRAALSPSSRAGHDA